VSRENVEIARQTYEALNRLGPEGVFPFMDADVETVESPEFADTGSFHGHDGFARVHKQFTDQFDEFYVEPEEFIDAGDKVVGCARLRGKGKLSGIDIDLLAYHVMTVNAGKIVRLDVFLDRAQAMAAAGLEREPEAPD
jgi:ketosteroid isomerase-like protein